MDCGDRNPRSGDSSGTRDAVDVLVHEFGAAVVYDLNSPCRCHELARCDRCSEPILRARRQPTQCIVTPGCEGECR
jgi:hypothetical protein